MTNRRGVNVLAQVEGGRCKAGRGKIGDRRWKMGGWVVVLLVAVSLAAAQEGGWKAHLERMGFEVPIEDLEKGEIVGQKWMVKGAGPGFLGARAFFIAPAEPKEVAKKVLEFDPTRGKTLEWAAEGSVKLYEAFSRPPSADDWIRFNEALGKPPFDVLLQVEGRKEGKIHLHPEEIQKVRDNKTEGWIQVLENRIQTYHQGGWEKNKGVPAGPDKLIDFDANLTSVLSEEEQGPVLKEFRSVLVLLANAGKAKDQTVEFRDYWQLMEVDKAPAVALGCAVLKEGPGGRYEVADMHYYASNGYFGAVSLYGIWPYGDGKSLVCRIDAVETDPYQLSQATARMIGEGLFLREVKTGCQTILDKIKGS